MDGLNKKRVCRYYVDRNSLLVYISKGELRTTKYYNSAEGTVEFKGDKSDFAKLVSDKEGYIYNNAFWLSERDDKLARQILIDSGINKNKQQSSEFDAVVPFSEL